jgi:hypothetical protein
MKLLSPPKTVARFLLKLVGWFGRPKGIRTDGGSQYDNHLIDVLCHLLGFKFKFEFDRHVTRAYRPHRDAQACACQWQELSECAHEVTRSRSTSSVHLPGSAIREQVELHACCLLFRGLQLSRYHDQHPAMYAREVLGARGASSRESFSVDFKQLEWTDSSYRIPFLVLCSRAAASQPSRQRIGGCQWWQGNM